MLCIITSIYTVKTARQISIACAAGDVIATWNELDWSYHIRFVAGVCNDTPSLNDPGWSRCTSAISRWEYSQDTTYNARPLIKSESAQLLCLSMRVRLCYYVALVVHARRCTSVQIEQIAFGHVMKWSWEKGLDVVQVDEPALREELFLCSSGERAKCLDYTVKGSGWRRLVWRTQPRLDLTFATRNSTTFLVQQYRLTRMLFRFRSPSRMLLLRAFVDEVCLGRIGAGLYDINSPRVPSEQEIDDRWEKFLQDLKLE